MRKSKNLDTGEHPEKFRKIEYTGKNHQENLRKFENVGKNLRQSSGKMHFFDIIISLGFA